MKKIFLKLFLLLFPCLFFLNGCGFSNGDDSAESKYQIVANSTRFVVNTDKFIFTYNDGEKIDTSRLVVTFDDKTLTYDEYFLTTNDAKPLDGKIGKDATLSGSNKQQQFQFYIAYQFDEERKIFVSDGITITINNEKGSTPWVYWVVSGVVIAAIAVVLFLRSKDKAKKNSNEEPKKAFYHVYETDKKQTKNDEPVMKVMTEEERKAAEEKEKNNPFITSFAKKEQMDKEKEQTSKSDNEND